MQKGSKVIVKVPVDETNVKIRREDIEPFIEYLRMRMNEYVLYIFADGCFALDGVRMNDNHLICILKRDLEANLVTPIQGKVRDKMMKHVLHMWRQKLLKANWDRQKYPSIRVKLLFDTKLAGGLIEG